MSLEYYLHGGYIPNSSYGRGGVWPYLQFLYISPTYTHISYFYIHLLFSRTYYIFIYSVQYTYFHIHTVMLLYILFWFVQVIALEEEKRKEVL